MADKKVVFVAFAIEDVRCRDLLKGQSLHTDSPFEYVDMSVTEPYGDEWKKKVRTRILRSDGVIALVSKNSRRPPDRSGRFNAPRMKRSGCAASGRIRRTGRSWPV